MPHESIDFSNAGKVIGWVNPYALQETNERRFAKKHINKYVETFIKEDPALSQKILDGKALLQQWLEGEYWDSKNERLAQVATMDLDDLVLQIYVGTAYFSKAELFVSATTQLAAKLGWADKTEAITTMAEICAVLSHTDVFDIDKATSHPQSSVVMVSNIELPPAILDAMARSQYVPPMVSIPMEVESNFESPYYTFNESQVLGKQAAHSGNICLDALNLQNRIPLSLNVEFLKAVEEKPTHDIDDRQKSNEWSVFRNQSNETYLMLIQQGNKFYITNKVDKRGRMYAQGYHVTTQGVPHKKAMIELANKEVINGVPA